MLSSIHPLGERARQSRWGLTVGFYLAASTAAGAAVGLLSGLAGAGISGLLGSGGAPVAVLVVVIGLAGAALDTGVAGLSVPSIWARQVDDDWLNRYRGWVYGAGFGMQLGAGVATFVTTAAVYVTWLLAVLAASPVAGLAIGATFGLSRALMIFTMAGVRDPGRLRSAHRRLDAWAAPMRKLAAGAQVALAVVAGIAVAA